jgi:hypothetical protein
MGAPFNFEEARNSTFYHDLRIFIFGADVTPWITSSVTLQKVDRDGVNMLSFSLSNSYRAFDITDKNLEGVFRNIEPTGPGGGYSERAKSTIYALKQTKELNVKHQVASFKANRTTYINDASKAPDDVTVRYPMSEGSLVFHKYDPVRFFVKNPLNRSQNQWTCEFTGYLDSKPYSQDYVNGGSVINITCQDIRALMQVMRTQTNPMAQTGNDNTVFFGNAPGSTIPAGDLSFFNDLISGHDTLSHVLAGKDFVTSIKYLLFGVSKDGGRVGGVGKLTEGKTMYYDPADERGRASVLEEWNNLINFGTTPLPSAEDAAPRYPVGGKTAEPIQTEQDYNPDSAESQKALAVKQSSFEATPSGIAEKEGRLKTKEGFYTEAEMIKLGNSTVPGREGSPDNARVHFLFPAEGAPLNNLITFSNVDASGPVAKIEFSSRMELLNQMCKSIDYQMYVTGMGDIVFEFPMYDFLPIDFNKQYGSLYTFRDHIVSDNINDEGGTPITALEVTSTFMQEEVQAAGLATSVTGGIEVSGQLKKTIFSNALASRVGVHIEPFHIPGVTKPNRLAQIGYIEFNKRLSNYNIMDMIVSYRPWIGVNRPVHHARKSRMALTNNVTYTWRIREDAALEMGLLYTRKLEGTGDKAEFRLITGSQRTPISYKTIFDGISVLNSGVTHSNRASNEADEKDSTDGATSVETQSGNAGGGT